MMYRKATLFGDTEIVGEIMSTDDVGRVKELGRSVRNSSDVIWKMEIEEYPQGVLPVYYAPLFYCYILYSNTQYLKPDSGCVAKVGFSTV